MDMADQFLQVREIGQTKYEEFAKENLKEKDRFGTQ